MYIIVETETESIIDTFETEEQALFVLKQFEEDDILDGVYQENFYKIKKV